MWGGLIMLSATVINNNHNHNNIEDFYSASSPASARAQQAYKKLLCQEYTTYKNFKKSKYKEQFSSNNLQLYTKYAQKDNLIKTNNSASQTIYTIDIQ